AKSIKHEATLVIPALTKRVATDSELEAALAAADDEDTAILVLFTEASSTRPLVTAMGYALRDTAQLIEAVAATTKDSAAKFGVEAAPGLVLIARDKTSGNLRRLVFEGNLKDIDSVVAFAKEHVHVGAHEEADQDAPTMLGSTLVLEGTDAFRDTVLGGNAAWVIAVLEKAAESPLTVDALDETLTGWSGATKSLGAGHLRAGVLLCDKGDMTSSPPCKQAKALDGTLPAILVYPHQSVEERELSAHTCEDVRDAVDAAEGTLPRHLVTSLYLKGVPLQQANQLLSKFMTETVLADPGFLETSMVLIAATKEKQGNDPTKPSILVQSLAAEFPNMLKVVHIVEPAVEVAQMFGVERVPGVGLLFTAPEDPASVDSEAHQGRQSSERSLTGTGYDSRMMGPPTFSNLVNWINMIASRREALKAHADAGAGGQQPVAATLSNVDLVEITADSWEKDVCLPNQTSLCIIALVPTASADTQAKAADPLMAVTEVLQNTIPLRPDGSNPWQVAFVRADCQPEFVAGLGFQADLFSSGTLPSMLVYIPKRSRVSHLVGHFEKEAVRSFLSDVFSSKASSSVLHQIPAPVKRNCTDFMLEMRITAGEEDEGDMADMMAEILKEEEARRKQLEEDLERERQAAAAVLNQDSKKKLKKKNKKKKKASAANAEL
ncbi:hypothetical protein JKP88DRAFT_95570, partial [Tribonema minus]